MKFRRSELISKILYSPEDLAKSAPMVKDIITDHKGKPPRWITSPSLTKWDQPVLLSSSDYKPIRNWHPQCVSQVWALV